MDTKNHKVIIKTLVPFCDLGDFVVKYFLDEVYEDMRAKENACDV